MYDDPIHWFGRTSRDCPCWPPIPREGCSPYVWVLLNCVWSPLLLMQGGKPITFMFSVLTSAMLLISLCSRLTSAFACRQCHGPQTIIFVNAVTTAQATDFMKKSLGPCATDNDYTITGITQTGLKFVFDLKVWRYCGVGGSNFVNRGAHCIDKICTTADTRGLACTKTVECGMTYDCRSCNL